MSDSRPIREHRKDRLQAWIKRDPSMADYREGVRSPDPLQPHETPEKVAALEQEFGPLKRTSAGILTHSFDEEREPFKPAWVKATELRTGIRAHLNPGSTTWSFRTRDPSLATALTPVPELPTTDPKTGRHLIRHPATARRGAAMGDAGF